MKKSFIGITTGVALLALAVAWSQQPPPPQGPPGQPGPGQFGPRLGMMTPPNSAVAILGLREVHDELDLSPEQRDEVRAAGRDLQETMDDVLFGIDPQEMEKLTPEEREQKMVAMRDKIDAAHKTTEAKQTKVLNAEQTKRLEQLKLQREGAGAMQREDIAKRLELTEEQLKKIGELSQRGFAGFGPPQITPQLKADLLAVLTKDQQTKWASLTGEDFAFPAMRGPGGRGPGGFGPGGGGPGGPGGFGPGGGPERELLVKFDTDKSGWLNQAERKIARETAGAEPRRGFGPPGGFGPGGPGGGPPGMRGNREPGKPGIKVNPDDVEPASSGLSLYDPTVVRTLFFEFENADWETELEAFHNSDVDVPATLTVDGQKYEGVGVHFRGMSSYGGVPAGSKRSLNVSLDLVNGKQRLMGYKTLNLLNAHEDPTFMHTVLYSRIAREHIPAPKANFVRVVINGESWGLYSNAQQFDKVFLSENYGNDKGTRWKVQGSPGGRGGLEYSGDNVADYKARFEIKSKDDAKAWQALITLCKTLNQTPVEELEAKITSLLDIDSTLWFLALDCALQNGDGYWTRASDYCIYLDGNGKFHIVPHDMNETLQAAGGGPGGPRGGGPMGGGRPGEARPGEARPGEGRPGEARPGEARPGEARPGEGRPGEGRPMNGGRGPMGGGGFGPPGVGGGIGAYSLDPLVGLADDSKPLRSKLLAVPKFKAQYLKNVRAIAEVSLAPEKFNASVEELRKLIEKEVQADTRKLSSMEEFERSLTEPPGEGGQNRHNLVAFGKQRREFLLNHSEIKGLAK